jgi:hypothetical protein
MLIINLSLHYEIQLIWHILLLYSEEKAPYTQPVALGAHERQGIVMVEKLGHVYHSIWFIMLVKILYRDSKIGAVITLAIEYN